MTVPPELRATHCHPRTNPLLFIFYDTAISILLPIVLSFSPLLGFAISRVWFFTSIRVWSGYNRWRDVLFCVSVEFFYLRGQSRNVPGIGRMDQSQGYVFGNDNSSAQEVASVARSVLVVCFFFFFSIEILSGSHWDIFLKWMIQL